MIQKLGLIKKAVAGVYYVIADAELIECKARGVFRNKNQTPLVGDHVKITQESNGEQGIITELLPRRNEFLRPAVANLDKLFIVASTCEPAPSHIVIDKLIAICEYKDVEPVLIITKVDLKDGLELAQIYRNAGFRVITLSNNSQTEDFSEVKNELCGCVSAFAGNTGVGKSSLLNNIYETLALETSHISRKLGRGRHTTRHVELFELTDRNGYVADTPGFGSIEVERYDIILKDKLQYCFREFEPYLGKCKFTGCSHTVEKGCEVLAAYEKGEIEKTRLESYKAMYCDAKNIKEWELK